MKTFMTLMTVLMISLNASAKSFKNDEYATKAVIAAKAVSELNWQTSPYYIFEVIRENYTDDGVHLFGTYKVRLFIQESSSSKKEDGGTDFEVYIFDGSVRSVTVNCRTCG